MRRKYIRLFVSSTFADMVRERDVLQRSVFPRISEYCTSHGWGFDGIDLRWGISRESSLEQKTMTICLNELHRCQQISPKPNFLVLIGERYGWQPLPEKLSTVDYNLLVSEATSSEKSLLEEWYKQDSNFVDSSKFCHILQPREKKGQYDFTDDDYYDRNVYKPLRALITKVLRKHTDDELWFRLAASATETEILHGALRVEDANTHVMVYERKLKDIPQSEKNTFSHSSGFREVFIPNSPARRLQRIKRALESRQTKKIALDCTYDYYLSKDFEEYFEKEIYEVIKSVVDKEIENYQEIPQWQYDSLSSWDIAENHNSQFNGVSPQFVEWLENNTFFNIYGYKDEGTTPFFSALACDVKNRGKMDIILRYPNENENIWTAESLWKSIWDELNSLYPFKDKTYSMQSLREVLENLQVRSPLVIAIDSLFDGYHSEETKKMEWLPARLAPGIHLLYTSSKVIPLTPGISIKNMMFAKINDFDKVVDLELKSKGRRLTSQQKETLNQAVDNHVKEYNIEHFIRSEINLICSDLASLTSYDSLSEFKPDYDYLLQKRIKDLCSENKYGNLAQLVLICAGLNTGITIDDFRHFVTTIENFWSKYKADNSVYFNIATNILPSSVIVRILNEMDDLIEYICDNNLYLFRLKNERIKGCLFHMYHDFWAEIQIYLYGFYLDKFRRQHDSHSLIVLSDIAAGYWHKELTLHYISSMEFFVFKYLHNIEDRQMGIYANLLNNPYLDAETSALVKEWKTFDVLLKSYLSKDDESLNKKLHSLFLCSAPDCIKEPFTREKIIEGDKNVMTILLISALSAGYSPKSPIRKTYNEYIQGLSFPVSMLNTMVPNLQEERFCRPLPIQIGRQFSDIIFTKDVVLWINPTTKLAHFVSLNALCSDVLTFGEVLGATSIGDDVILINKSQLRHVHFISENFTDESFTINLPFALDPDQKTKMRVCRHHNAKGLYILIQNGLKLYVYEWEDFTTANLNVKLNGDYRIQGEIIDIFDNGKLIALKEWYIEKDSEGKDMYRFYYVIRKSETLEHVGSIKEDCLLQKVGYSNDYAASAKGKIFAFSFPKNKDIYYLDYSKENVPIKGYWANNAPGRGPIYLVNIDEDAKTILSLGGDQCIRRFNIPTETLEHIAIIKDERITPIVNSDNSAIFAIPDFNKNTNFIFHLDRAYSQSDYLPTALYQMRTDASGQLTICSFGSMHHAHKEGAYKLEYNPVDSNWKTIHEGATDGGDEIYARSVAVKEDGTQYAYTRGETLWVCTGKSKRKEFLPHPRRNPEKDNDFGDIVQLSFLGNSNLLIGFYGWGEMVSPLLSHIQMAQGQRPSHRGADGFIFNTASGSCKYINSKDLFGDKINDVDFMKVSADGRFCMVYDKLTCYAISFEIDGLKIIDCKKGEISFPRPSMNGITGEVSLVKVNSAFSRSGNLAYVGVLDNKNYLITYNAEKYIEKKMTLPDNISCVDVQWAFDNRHIFIISGKYVILCDSEKGCIVQYFDFVYEDDDIPNFFNFGSFEETNVQVFSNGLLFYDGRRMFRLEVANGLVIK